MIMTAFDRWALFLLGAAVGAIVMLCRYTGGVQWL